MYEEPTFPKFLELPQELRILIWKAAVVPRVVNIRRCPLLNISNLDWHKKNLGWEKEIPSCAAADLLAFVEAGLEHMDMFEPIPTPRRKAQLRTDLLKAIDYLKGSPAPKPTDRFNLKSIANAYITAGIENQYLYYALGLNSIIELEILMNFTPNVPPDDARSRLQFAVWDYDALKRDEYLLTEPLCSLGTDSMTPSILLACQESRQIGLEHYDEVFISHQGYRGVYFDFERDTLYLRWDQLWDRPIDYDAYSFHPDPVSEMPEGLLMNAFWDSIDSEKLRRVKNLAYFVHPGVTGADEEDVTRRCSCMAFLMDTFSGVERFTLVMHHEDGEESEGHKYGPCVLIDPIDVRSTIANLQNFNPHEALSLAMPEEEPIEIDEIEVDPEEVIELLAEHFWSDGVNDPPTIAPTIEYKIAISEAVAWELESSRVSCRAKIEGYLEEGSDAFEEY